MARNGNMTTKLFRAVLAFVILVIIISTVVSCDSEPEVIQQDTVIYNVNAETILNDFKTNETAANINWKGKHLLVTLEDIDEIEDRGRVIKYLDSYGFNHIQLDFANDDDVVDLAPGDSVVANCELDGYQLDSWLEFNDCKWE